MASNLVPIRELLARSTPRLPSTIARAAPAANAIRTVGVSRLPPAKIAEIGKRITTMPVSSRSKILSVLKDRKVQIGGVAITVGSLLALNETDLGNTLLDATTDELQALLGLFDSVDGKAGDAVAEAYNDIMNLPSSASLDRDYDKEAALGVPMVDNVPGIGLDMNEQNVRQSLTLALRNLLRLGLTLDDILFLQLGFQRFSPNDWNVLADEVRFVERY